MKNFKVMTIIAFLSIFMTSCERGQDDLQGSWRVHAQETVDLMIEESGEVTSSAERQQAIAYISQSIGEMNYVFQGDMFSVGGGIFDIIASGNAKQYHILNIDGDTLKIKVGEKVLFKVTFIEDDMIHLDSQQEGKPILVLVKE